MFRDRFTRLPCAAAVLAIVLVGPGPAGCDDGELPPGFPLCLRQASHIVHGDLAPSGALSVQAVLKGGPIGERVTVDPGQGAVSSFTSSWQQPGTYEVLLFLSEAGHGRWDVVLGGEGVVGFRGEAVYTLGHDGRQRSQTRSWEHYPHLTRSGFLKTVRDWVDAAACCDRLLAEPASADRMRKLIHFLQTGDPRARQFYRARIAHAVRPVAPPEEAALVRLLERPDFPVHLGPLLEDVRVIGLESRRVFDAVAPYTKRGVPPEVRQAAIETLAGIDASRAQEALVPLLDVDDPELCDLLRAVRGDTGRPSPKVVEPLLRLAAAVRERHRVPGQRPLLRESHLLCRLLGEVGHPRLIGVLLEWSLDGDHETTCMAHHALRHCLGRSPAEDADAPSGEAWMRWWLGAKDALFAHYDLTTAGGRAIWYRAYEEAASPTQKPLMRLWAFEPAVDEAALIREASDKGHGATARTVLAGLWQHGRLSAAGKRAVVERFLEVRLEEAPAAAAPPQRELRIVARSRFPFPENVWARYDYGITVGGGEPKQMNVGNQRALESAGSQVLGTLGGFFPGQREARALLEVSESVPAGGKPGWSCRWELGPVRLRDAAGP